MDRKPWLKKDANPRENTQKKSIGGSLKRAYSWPKWSSDFNLKNAVISGLGTGFLYGAVFILPLLATEAISRDLAVLFFSVGAFFGLLMGVVCERWVMGFMIERIITILLGVSLLGVLFYFVGI